MGQATPILNIPPLVSAGADVPETKTGPGTREATSRARTLQEVFDAATDTLAKRWPLQRLPSQVTPIHPTEETPGRWPPPF